MSRPYMSLGITELRAVFEAGKSKVAELELLFEELSHRKTKAARALRAQVAAMHILETGEVEPLKPKLWAIDFAPSLFSLPGMRTAQKKALKEATAIELPPKAKGFSTRGRILVDEESLEQFLYGEHFGGNVTRDAVRAARRKRAPDYWKRALRKTRLT